MTKLNITYKTSDKTDELLARQPSLSPPSIFDSGKGDGASQKLGILKPNVDLTVVEHFRKSKQELGNSDV